MRVTLALLLLAGFASSARSDEPQAEEVIPWQTPFQAISASDADDALVLVLITNEDPFATADSAPAATRNKIKLANPIPPVWCADVLGHAYLKTIRQRADLRGRLTIQSIAAGLPKELTGGEARNLPARAVLALCDGSYRLLAVTVGVPDADELLTLIEDGEDVAAMRQLHAEDRTKTVHLIAQRSSERLSRLWRGVLEEVVVAMHGDEDDDPGQDTESEQAFIDRMRLLGETFTPTYMADVRLRFGLTDAADRTRLVVLEQHPETRRPWCAAMIPFIAGSDFNVIWRELVESIWGHAPITADGEATELIEWFDTQIKTDAIVLSLKPPLHLRHLPWPPVTDKAARRGAGWQQVHELALEHPFRKVDAQQLAVLIRSRDLAAVDIERPSLARYLYLEPRKRLPYVVREGDPPGRFAGRLKRSNSSLVSE